MYDCWSLLFKRIFIYILYINNKYCYLFINYDVDNDRLNRK